MRGLLTRGARHAPPSLNIGRTMAFLRTSRCCGPSAARLHVVPGKAQGMIASEGEMKAVMAFWAETLGNRPPGEDLIEIST